MRPALSTDENSGSSRFQADDEVNDELAHDVTFVEILQCSRSDYERHDVAKPKPHAVAIAAPMASVSWSTAQRLQGVSDAAFAIEMRRRGYEIARKILSGKYYDSGKRKHKKRKGKLK
jgi:hypothetical protein